MGFWVSVVGARVEGSKGGGGAGELRVKRRKVEWGQGGMSDQPRSLSPHNQTTHTVCVTARQT